MHVSDQLGKRVAVVPLVKSAKLLPSLYPFIGVSKLGVQSHPVAIRAKGPQRTRSILLVVSTCSDRSRLLGLSRPAFVRNTPWLSWLQHVFSVTEPFSSWCYVKQRFAGMGKFAQLVVGPAGCGKVMPNRKSCLQWIASTIGSRKGQCVTLNICMLLQSTYCDHLRQHCEAVGRTVHTVNLGKLSVGFYANNTPSLSLS